MDDYNARLASFNEQTHRWPHQETTLTAERLAKLGFLFRPTKDFPDRIECFRCGGQLCKFRETDDPEMDHKEYYLDCYLLQKKFDDGSGAIKETIDGYVARLASFAVPSHRWPHQETKLTAEHLAKSGFLFRPTQKYPDRVECFRCGGLLCKFEVTDDPEKLHDQYYPNCKQSSPVIEWSRSLPLAELLTDSISTNYPVVEDLNTLRKLTSADVDIIAATFISGLIKIMKRHIKRLDESAKIVSKSANSIQNKFQTFLAKGGSVDDVLGKDMAERIGKSRAQQKNLFQNFF